MELAETHINFEGQKEGSMQEGGMEVQSQYEPCEGIVTSSQQVIDELGVQVEASLKYISSKDELVACIADLENRPFIQAEGVSTAISGIGEKEQSFAWVELGKVVGMYGDRPDGFASEFSTRDGRLLEVASRIMQVNDHPEYLEEIYHFNNPQEQIQMQEIIGPAGPCYLINDGSHRTSASMAAGLERIPVQVEAVTYPKETVLDDPHEVRHIKELMALGLLKGTIRKEEDITRLIIDTEVVPWIRAKNQQQLIEISRLYESLYPDSLDDLDIPRDALIDPIANNMFMAGVWDEWEQRYKDASRDGDGRVIY
jgi:hypothetical protein